MDPPPMYSIKYIHCPLSPFLKSCALVDGGVRFSTPLLFVYWVKFWGGIKELIGEKKGLICWLCYCILQLAMVF